MSEHDPKGRTVGFRSATLMPQRYRDCGVECERDLPGIVIVVHGVNDLGVNYHALDSGLCMGLNERLDRADLFPNDYTLPKDDDGVLRDPDKVYYRLAQNDQTRSVIIPFYWGYRAAKKEIGKERKNGQVVDKHGNRLDEDFAKGGGMFANATSNIPDMFNGKFERGLLVAVADMFSDDAHPLLTGPERRYMVLAAKRLAALIAEIRAIAPADTVTVIGHSQGCVISLLAQAFLSEDGVRCADALILQHPPYGIHEPGLDRVTQSGRDQQTTQARINTLVNLVHLVTKSPKDCLPPLSELADPMRCRGRAGPKWSPGVALRGSVYGDPPVAQHEFEERDNRGKVYLYFCPHDMTVGLASVQGIGTFGVPDRIEAKDGRGGATKLDVFPRLGAGFLQRVWTWRERGGRVRVGAKPGQHALRIKGEPSFDAGLSGWAKTAGIAENDMRTINGEPLNPTLVPDLHYSELKRNGDVSAAERDPRYVGDQKLDPIDAAIAVTKGQLRAITETFPWEGRLPTCREYEERFNAGKKDPTTHTKVYDVTIGYGSRIHVRRSETPDEARARYQTKEKVANSYHSSIVVNPEHHRWVTAMDVAVGQARALDDPDWRDLLIAIADWRTNATDDMVKFKKYQDLRSQTYELIEATATYYRTGVFPNLNLVPGKLPGAVESQTLAQRDQRGAKYSAEPA